MVVVWVRVSLMWVMRESAWGVASTREAMRRMSLECEIVTAPSARVRRTR